MNLTRLALENNRTTTVALFCVVFGGLMAFGSMPRSEDPGFTIRFALITTYFPGANPERVELLVTDKIEKAVQELPELRSVKSESRTGISIVYVEIKDAYSDMRPIWDNLRRKIDKIRSSLPSGIIGPNVNDEFGDVFGIVVGITGPGFEYAELKEIADSVRDELLLLRDVAKVDIYGAQEERVFVEYNNARLAQLGLSPSALLDILQTRNIIIPGGYANTGAERVAIEPSGNFDSVEDMRRTVVKLPKQGGVVFLGDVVDIRRAYIDPPRQMMRCSGEACLALAISMREGGNIVTLGDQVKPLIGRLEASYPWGISLDFLAFQPDVVTQKVDDFVNNLLQAVGIVIAVMLLTLGLRTGILVASLIPSAIVMALLVMQIVGIGLHQMSLASLIIALGLLVDNAIVMAESIMVQLERGKNRLDAVLDSVAELRVPLLVASLTTAAAFLPFYLAEGVMGEYVGSLFSVVSITLLCSWLLAITLVPMLCFYFMKSGQRRDEQAALGAWPYRLYRGALLRILQHPVLSLAGITVLFLGVMSLAGLVPAMFFPTLDAPIFLGDIEISSATPIERTEEVVAEIDAYIQQELQANEARPEGIDSWAAFVGQGGPRFRLAYNPLPANSGYASMLFNTTSYEVAAEMKSKLDAFCRQRFADVQATFKDLMYGPPVNYPVEVQVTGRNIEEIFRYVEAVKAKLHAIAGTSNVDDDWGQRTKKLVVAIDQARARRAGITNQDVAVSLQTIFSGLESTQFRERDKVIPITLRTVAADRQDLGKLQALNVYSQRTGAPVPLKQVADIEMGWDPAKVLRKDRLRAVTVRSQLRPGFLAADVVASLKPWLVQQSKSWSVGTRYELGGADKAADEANESVNAKLPFAGFIILILLIGQFNSLRRTAIILVTIPLALIGVILGLLVAKSYFGFMTFLGIISLAGIVINNAIVLIDRIRIEISEHGLEPARAIVQAAQLRMRPILLTTATTVGGLLPLWLGGGPMWEPMAVAIMFGLMFSTMLTLGFVPVAYSLLFRVSFKEFRY